ncbi:helix-turn-helix domain-containing protein [Microbispora sp. CA-135349]|uniref:helix-turn-helix domain-containing protein n=1 Tax=Microbispora sp. CA-135349 TaxID=3239953 RepID=UPI003D907005
MESLIDHDRAMRERASSITLPLTQAELASLIGSSRETVERILRGWRQRGIVRTAYRPSVIGTAAS